MKLLGFAVVRQLCIGFSVLDANRTGGCTGFDYRRFWSRSLATGLAAQAFFLRIRVLAAEESFTCGLLADIGSLALASLYPEKINEVLTIALSNRVSSTRWSEIAASRASTVCLFTSAWHGL